MTIRWLPDYISYVRQYLFRHSTFNGRIPVRWELFADEWLAEDDADGEDWARDRRRLSSQDRYV